MATLYTPERYVLGAGKIYYSEDDGVTFRYLAETPDFTLSIASETSELKSFDSPVAETLCEVQTAKEVNGTLTTVSISPANVAMFLGGAVSSVAESGQTDEAEDFTVAFDTWFQLGSTDDATDPPEWGYTNVASVSAAEDPEGTPQALAEDVDYEIDYLGGMVRFLDTSILISAGDTVRVTYDVTAGNDAVVQSNAEAQPERYVKFVSNNTCGTNNVVVLPACRLSPSGDWAQKSRSDFQQLQWDLLVMRPESVSRSMIEVIQRMAA